MSYEKKISFIIPTNRNFQTHVSNVIDNINSFNSKYDYEICIFSQQKIEGQNVVWYPEEDRKGPIYGFNHVAKKCNGEYIICLTDDHVIVNSFDNVIDLLESKKDEEFVISSLNPGGFCGNPVFNELLGDKLIDFLCPKFSLVRFPVIHKNTLNNKLDGVIFNEHFYYHAGDIWLGFYLGMNGVAFSDGPTFITQKNPAKDPTWEVADCNVSRELMKKMCENKINYNFKLEQK